ncbi:Toxin RTX-I translocation ATP-binding protein [Zhongshania aliphaticivorans]|uniref:Toxin RTX-I translocation ATP-binding protein n=1 Tax=Zhongshania aliphaticivorans TaxID=1470434 RepID=A0A5S9NNZ3_9GAMM|nr:type I secretion system permease/ATPase [Zhongshania aliphaticivorans]CAA0092112.1 Toxin RTX-I translocation ATP-binding protein [Zhongshania aliphaticivorans]CAA0109235.1 Toxin RTX-I translocation ATP-binding protein [Zhongshania aliphaticivorans]
METQFDDPLSSCLLKMAEVHGITTSRGALVDGLGLVGGRLTPALVARAAKRVGLVTNIAKQPLARINQQLLPCIILQEDSRASVLERLDIAAGKAWLRLPELGMALQEVDLDSLQDGYIGMAIYCRQLFQPNENPDVESESLSGRGEHWFWRTISANRRVYRDVLVAAFFVNILALTMPLFVMNVYDRVVPNHATDTLWVLAAGAILIICADLSLRMLRSWFVELAAQRADVVLSSRIMESILGMRMEHNPPSIGSFAANVQAFESVRSFIGSMVVVALIDLPFFLLFILIIALISFYMAVPVFIGALVVLLYALSVQGRMHQLAETSNQASAQRNAGLIESLATAQTLKAFNASGRMQALWEQATVFLSGCSGKQRLLGGSVAICAAWVQQSVAVAMMIVGVYLVIAGDMSQGALIAAYMLSSRALAPVSQVASLLTQYHQAATAMESLDGIMANEQERVPGKQLISRPQLRGEIEFRNVSFVYPGEQRPALSDVSFHLLAGERVAILGQAGSGKSTIEKLILGLYRPTEGSIFIDGVHIEQLDIAELRRAVGYIPQDLDLLSGSVYDNITLGTDVPSRERLFQAVEKSGLASLVGTNADGLSMQVGEGGRRLSGGQRQAIAVARALMPDSAMLLLDEPTSAMDSMMENHVSQSLAEFSKGKTLLLVTHRTSLLHMVEKIIIMDGGCIAANGPKQVVLQALDRGTIQRKSV